MPTAPRTDRTDRATARADLTRAILDSATGQLVAVGPAALSVRAVARDLGLASSAVYRYVPSRDALLTALLAEAHDDLGDAVERAEAAVRRSDLRGRWRALAHALRDWARAHPHQYALAHGSPVPGYTAPADDVAATRALLTLLVLLRDAQIAGRAPAGPARVSASEKAALAPVLTLVEPALSPAYGVRGLTAWAALLGQVSLEVLGQRHHGVLDADAHATAVIDLLGADLGLRPG